MKTLDRLVLASLSLLACLSLSSKTMAQSSNAPLTNVDIGTVVGPSYVTNGNGYYLLTGSGTGLSGTSDSLEYAYQAQTGDFIFDAQVWSQTNGGETGVLVRTSLDPAAPFLEVAYQAGVGTVVQLRTASGQNSTIYAEDTTATAPELVCIARQGNNFTVYEGDPDGSGWVQLGGTVVLDWASTVDLGLVEASDVSGLVASGNVDNVLFLPYTVVSSQDIGSPTLLGSTDYNNGLTTLVGSGTGLGGKKDQGIYTYSWYTGNFTEILPLTAFSPSGTTDQAGFSIRSSLVSSSPEISLVLTPNNGVVELTRSGVGAATTTTYIAPQITKAPVYLQITRAGNVFTVAASADGTNWTSPVTTNLTLTQQVFFGLAVSSGNPSQYAKATFGNFSGTGFGE